MSIWLVRVQPRGEHDGILGEGIGAVAIAGLNRRKIIIAAAAACVLAAIGIASPDAPSDPAPTNPQPRVLTVPLLSLAAITTPYAPGADG
jgi:hypothetical protein